MYTDLFLSFPDEATAKSILYRIEGALEATDEAPAVEGYEVPNFQNIDTIGVIYKPTGEMLQGEDGEYPEMAPIAGWHVNVRLVGEDGTTLMPYAVTPTTPVRVFGGAIPAPSIPQSVSMRQGRLALLGAGMLEMIDAAIAAIEDPVMRQAATIEWQYANTIERNSAFVQQMVAGLGLTDAQMDALFVEAAKL